jgi:hypothetical protein
MECHENQFGFTRNGDCDKALSTFRYAAEYFRQKIVMYTFLHWIW